jgi:hypothetical protein
MRSLTRQRLYQPEIDRQRENVARARLNLAEQERRLRELLEGFARPQASVKHEIQTEMEGQELRHE